MKLSPDGTTWTEALVADPATASLALSAPLGLASSTIAALPAATTPGQLAYVSDESGGPVLAFSDGTNWRRVTDRAVVS